MKGDSIEVYCKNKGCGEPEVHSDIMGQHETMKYRRMNFMGSREVNAAMAVTKSILGVATQPSGSYYLYQCPVCGAKRAYHESGGMTSEVDAGILDNIKG